MSQSKLKITKLDTVVALSDEELEKIRGGSFSSLGYRMLNPQPLPPRFFSSSIFRSIVIGS